MTFAEFLELLRIVVSWPVAAVVVALIFQTPIRGLIDRVRSVSGPGGMQIQLQLQKAEAPIGGEGEIKPPAPTLPAGLGLTPEQQALLKEAFAGERAAARLWEYRYLNFFLARGTQLVLEWFISVNQATTFDAVEAYWIPLIPEANQRKIIIDVLQAHYLIEIDGPIMKVSEKAKEYVKWRGPLAPLPALESPAAKG